MMHLSRPKKQGSGELLPVPLCTSSLSVGVIACCCCCLLLATSSVCGVSAGREEDAQAQIARDDAEFGHIKRLIYSDRSLDEWRKVGGVLFGLELTHLAIIIVSLSFPCSLFS